MKFAVNGDQFVQYLGTVDGDVVDKKITTNIIKLEVQGPMGPSF